ncbi:MAG: MmgE/PrpD family protein [Minwuiales bacterium]|nr:MmgE/PrpD family protein [Minwuiales bacterium]
MYVADHYAAFIAATAKVPASAQRMAVLAVLDLAAAALAGYSTSGAAAARRAAEQIWGMGDAPVWFSRHRLPPVGAAFANSAAASMLDLDDGHRAAAGHPGAAIIPAVMAAAHGGETDAPHILTAIALGYEIATRASAARDLSCVDTLVSGRWVGHGVAAAVAWMRGLTEPQIAQAIAIAGTSAPSLGPVAYSRIMGNHLKEGIPWATATGLAAVDLAAAGFTAPIDLFDNAALFDQQTLTTGLSKDWMIEQIYFKPYSCCRWAHAAIQATLALLADHSLSARAIDHIRIETFSRALQLNNEPRPRTLEAAQYSVPFCVALAVLEGEESLLPMTESALSNSDVMELAERISIELAPDLDRMFPGSVPARVEVNAESRVYGSTVLMPKGEPSNPMTQSELEAKFHTLADPVLGVARAEWLLAAIQALGDQGSSPLLQQLGKPIELADGRLIAANGAGQ